MNNLGKHLKEQRLKNKYTQNIIADKMHIGRSTYAGWEAGKFYPDFEKFLWLCNFYNVSADYLLGRTQEDMEHLIEPPSSPIISEEQKKVLDYYDRLDEENKDYIRGTMVKLIKEQNAERKIKTSIS